MTSYDFIWETYFHKRVNHSLIVGMRTVLHNVDIPREQLYEFPTTEGLAECFSLDEIKKQMAKMGKGKACGPDELPIEAVQIVLECKPECIVETFNDIPKTKKMPNERRKNRMLHIFKGKGDVAY